MSTPAPVESRFRRLIRQRRALGPLVARYPRPFFQAPYGQAMDAEPRRIAKIEGRLLHVWPRKNFWFYYLAKEVTTTPVPERKASQREEAGKITTAPHPKNRRKKETV